MCIALKETDLPTHEELMWTLMYADEFSLVCDDVDNPKTQVDGLGLPAIMRVGFAIVENKDTSVALDRADLRTGLRLGC